MTKRNFIAAAIAVVLAGSASAQDRFELTSPTMKDGGVLAPRNILNGFGCSGANQSPALAWRGTPAGTRSFALTMYDPDATTGSGWWHWVLFDLPPQTSALPEGAAALPPSTVQGRTDFGSPGYGGACPPPGERHRYIFTLHALDTPSLGLPPESSAAMVGFNIHAHQLGKTTLSVSSGR